MRKTNYEYFKYYYNAVVKLLHISLNDDIDTQKFYNELASDPSYDLNKLLIIDNEHLQMEKFLNGEFDEAIGDITYSTILECVENLWSPAFGEVSNEVYPVEEREDLNKLTFRQALSYGTKEIFCFDNLNIRDVVNQAHEDVEGLGEQF